MIVLQFSISFLAFVAENINAFDIVLPEFIKVFNLVKTSAKGCRNDNILIRILNIWNSFDGHKLV